MTAGGPDQMDNVRRLGCNLGRGGDQKFPDRTLERKRIREVGHDRRSITNRSRRTLGVSDHDTPARKSRMSLVHYGLVKIAWRSLLNSKILQYSTPH